MSKRQRTTSSATSTRTTVWKRRLAIVGSGVAVIAVCVAIRAYVSDTPAEAQNAQPARSQAAPRGAAPTAGPQSPAGPNRAQGNVMAVVNGQDITRSQLAEACIERYGEEVLEGLVNKFLIQRHCRNRGIEVTPQEVNAEIEQMAQRFKISREQFLQQILNQRGVTPEQYANDIIWPMLALRKLAADELTVSEEEIRKAYESQFGASVRTRLIVVSDPQKAEQLHRQVVARPDDFARLAMQESEDVNSASIGGLIQPIFRHVGDPKIQQAVFSLQPGQISPIIEAENQFAIFKCEEHLPPRGYALDSVREQLVAQIKESKLREVASRKFEELQTPATVQNVWNDPQLRQRMPGVVALVDGEQITHQRLGEECLLRHGEEVLQTEILHLLLQQSLQRAGMSVTQADLDAEIAHAARLAGVVDQNGQVDLNEWFRIKWEEEGIEQDRYVRDEVWPSVALKKLTGGTVQVTQEDMQKGFQANYGERVRCRAIVLSDMRRAQEVWQKARENPSMEYFGDLAAEYSIESTTKTLRGEMPPIRRFGGEPQLEKTAFSLQTGELSPIVQLGNGFVILKCEGRTQPIEVDPNDPQIREILTRDIFEKKMRMAMAEKYNEIMSASRIENYLAGTSQSPSGAPQAGQQPTGPQQSAAPRRDTAVQPAGGNRTR